MTPDEAAATLREAIRRLGYGDPVDVLVAAAQQALRDVETVGEDLDACNARADRLAGGLERIAAQQPDTLKMIEANGFVFDDIGCEPGNWQHLAFTIYTDLCEVDSIARATLADDGATW